MSVLIEKVSAEFVQPAEPNGRYNFEFRAELFGHSEAQQHLLQAVLNAKSRLTVVELGTAPNGHESIRLLITAEEAEVRGVFSAKVEANAKRDDFAPAPVVPSDVTEALADELEEAENETGRQPAAPVNAGTTVPTTNGANGAN